MAPALPPPQVMGDVGEWFRRLTVADTGILYEDTYLQVGACSGNALLHLDCSLSSWSLSAAASFLGYFTAVPPQLELIQPRKFAYIQVGVKQGFQGASGQIQLFFGNKADAPLGRLICAVPPQPLFAFQLGPVPPYIEPKKQVHHGLPAYSCCNGRCISSRIYAEVAPPFEAMAVHKFVRVRLTGLHTQCSCNTGGRHPAVDPLPARSA